MSQVFVYFDFSLFNGVVKGEILLGGEWYLESCVHLSRNYNASVWTGKEAETAKNYIR